MTKKPPPSDEDRTIAELYIDGKRVQAYHQPTPPQPTRKREPPKGLNPSVFVGPKLKVERAKRHVADLAATIKAFHDRNPYQLIANIDPDTGEAVWRMRVKESVPIELSAIIGDAVHNLRSALDGIVCDLIRANTPQSDAMHGGFPVADRAKRLKPGTVSKIQGVSAKAERLILRLKARDGWNNTMWMLHWLDIIDKHNRIVAIAAATIEVTSKAAHPFFFQGPDGSLRLGGPGPDGQPMWLGPGTPEGFRPVMPLEDNVEVYRSPGALKQYVEAAITVAFSETKVTQGEPVVEALEQLTHLVERTLWIFERYTI